MGFFSCLLVVRETIYVELGGPDLLYHVVVIRGMFAGVEVVDVLVACYVPRFRGYRHGQLGDVSFWAGAYVFPLSVQIYMVGVFIY